MPRRGCEGFQGCPQVLDCLGGQAVVNPPARRAIKNQARVLQLLEMKGKTGLGSIEFTLKLADAALAAGQEPDDGEPGLFGEGLEAPDEGCVLLGCGGLHAEEYINDC